MPNFRTAILGDETRLAELAARTFRQTYERHSTPENLEAHLCESFFSGQQRKEISDPNMITLVLDAGMELIGYAQIRSGECPTSHGSDSDSELWRIYIDKSHQGNGFGSLLLAEALTAARSNDSTLIWLGVSEYNTDAIAFYQRSDFEEVGEHIFKLGDDLQRDLIMIKKLNSV